MKKQSTGQISEEAKREIEALRRMPDSEVNFSDIPLQNLNDPKWANAVVGKFYRPIKKPVLFDLTPTLLPGSNSRDVGISRGSMKFCVAK